MRKFLIKVNGNQYEVEVEEIRNDGSYTPATPVSYAPPVTAAPAAPTATPAAAPTPAPATPAPEAAPKMVTGGTVGSVKVTAPMPGTILRVDVNPGDKVKKGQVLLILEAMKMENEIVAPEDGTVASVNVSKGTSVSVGDLLVSLS